jgi:hypothetical protein
VGKGGIKVAGVLARWRWWLMCATAATAGSGYQMI